MIFSDGWYLLVEANDGETDDTARIISYLIKPTQDNCLIFWYHMHGDQVGTLNVYVTDAAGTGAVVWTRDTEQGDQWLRGQVGINYIPDSYHVSYSQCGINKR